MRSMKTDPFGMVPEAMRFKTCIELKTPEKMENSSGVLPEPSWSVGNSTFSGSNKFLLNQTINTLVYLT